VRRPEPLHRRPRLRRPVEQKGREHPDREQSAWSIELSASDTTKFGLKNLSDFGANSKLLKAGGNGSASWRVKLVRIH
jgi:hypothetical protein